MKELVVRSDRAAMQSYVPANVEKKSTFIERRPGHRSDHLDDLVFAASMLNVFGGIVLLAFGMWLALAAVVFVVAPTLAILSKSNYDALDVLNAAEKDAKALGMTATLTDLKEEDNALLPIRPYPCTLRGTAYSIDGNTRVSYKSTVFLGIPLNTTTTYAVSELTTWDRATESIVDRIRSTPDYQPDYARPSISQRAAHTVVNAATQESVQKRWWRGARKQRLEG